MHASSSFSSGRRVLVAVFCVLLVACVSGLSAYPAFAQAQPPIGRSYVTPFPPNERYQALVIGDGLAQGLASGLTEAFKQDGAIHVAEQTSYSFSLYRPGNFDWGAELDRILQTTPAQLVIFMSGVNDGRPIRTNDGAFKAGSPGWREAYGRTVEKIIKKLKSLNVPVYWTGMPVMGGAANNETMEAINEVLREKTYLNGVRFVDTWSGFADQFGGYSAYGPDLTGQSKRLRENDGIYFTAAGNRKLAHYVEVVLRRDLAAARTERNIPLAGDENEQKRLTPHETDVASRDADNANNLANDVKADLPDNGSAPEQRQEGALAARASLPAEVSPISATAPGSGGEMITGEIASGVTALASISPASDLNQRVNQSRIPAADRLYNKVLVQGEYLPPKAGRADDYAWPSAQSPNSKP